MKKRASTPTSLFEQKYQSGFYGILQWDQLDRILAGLKLDASSSWFIYETENDPPSHPATSIELAEFLDDVYIEVRREHKHDYCGFVYVDNVDSPSFIKIYHPKRMGVVCGIGREPVLPAWILSKEKPVDLRSR